MKNKSREKLFSVTAKDCRWDYFRGSGKGGQKRNKTENCARCTHEPSGAVGKSEEGRSKEQNRQRAFERMANTREFRSWIDLEARRLSGELALIDSAVENQLLRETDVQRKDENGEWISDPTLKIDQYDIQNIKEN